MARSQPVSPPSNNRRLSPSRQQAILSLSASPEAPDCFHSPHAAVVPRPQSRQPRPKFEYQDSKDSSLDFSSVRPRHYYDLLSGKNQGVLRRLPYYKAYYGSVEKGCFGVRYGLCARQLHRRAVERDQSHFLENLKRSASYNSKHKVNKPEKNTFQTSVLFGSFGRLPSVTNIRLRRSRQPSRLALEENESFRIMREIDEFDRRPQPQVALDSDNH